jgi:2-amino-4-hydroxy-6-hydroxymethyldihydropteridine diphosphokinase
MLQAQSFQKSAVKCLVAIGSNLSSPARSVSDSVAVALGLLAACDSINLTAQSRMFRTPAYPPGSGPDFVNAACEVSTRLSPVALLEVLHGVEAEMGRTRNRRWEARVLDLDLLACGDLVVPDAAEVDRWIALADDAQMAQAPDQLILPHPRLQDRGFVLAPLADIAPDWVHPLLGLSVAEMLAQLPAEALAGIVALS